MIDIHTHILPNVDDGPSSIDETFQMISEAEEAGFTDICTTSHYIEFEYEVNKFDRKCIVEAIQKKLNEQGRNIKLHNGAEAFISNELPNLVKKGIISTLADSNYILFELPFRTKVMYVDSIINNLLSLGYYPIIAHPERYTDIQEDPNVAISWIEEGALLQCNYATILGRYGKAARETIIKLLDVGAVHFLGTDTHRKNTVYTRMEEIIEELSKKIGKRDLKVITTNNPRYILENQKLEIEIPRKIKKNKFWM